MHQNTLAFGIGLQVLLVSTAAGASLLFSMPMAARDGWTTFTPPALADVGRLARVQIRSQLFATSTIHTRL